MQGSHGEGTFVTCCAVAKFRANGHHTQSDMAAMEVGAVTGGFQPRNNNGTVEAVVIEVFKHNFHIGSPLRWWWYTVQISC